MAVTLTQSAKNQTNASGATVVVTVTATAAGAILIVATGVNQPGAGYTVSSVTDNKSNTYTQGSSTSAVGASAGRSDIWYCLSPTSGVTSVTITFGTSDTAQKSGVVFEVAGFTTPALDVNGKVDNQTAILNNMNGASVTTTTTTGFVVGTCTCGSTLDQNPATGNEFSAGAQTNSNIAQGACSLISSTAAAHQPAWHSTFGTAFYCASTLAIKESGSGGIVNTVTATDNLFVPDTRTDILEKLIRDAILVPDRRSSILERVLRDFLLVPDSRSSLLEKWTRDGLLTSETTTVTVTGLTLKQVTDYLLVADAAIREISLTRLDNLLLRDATARELLKQTRDSLVLPDLRTSIQEHLIRDWLLLPDSGSTLLTPGSLTGFPFFKHGACDPLGVKTGCDRLWRTNP